MAVALHQQEARRISFRVRALTSRPRTCAPSPRSAVTLTCMRADARSRWRLARAVEGRVGVGSGQCQRTLQCAAGGRVGVRSGPRRLAWASECRMGVGSGPRPHTPVAEPPPCSGVTTMTMRVLGIGCAPLNVLSASVDTGTPCSCVRVCARACACVDITLCGDVQCMLPREKHSVLLTVK